MLKNVSDNDDANRTRHKKYNFVFEDMAGVPTTTLLGCASWLELAHTLSNPAIR